MVRLFWGDFSSISGTSHDLPLTKVIFRPPRTPSLPPHRRDGFLAPAPSPLSPPLASPDSVIHSAVGAAILLESVATAATRCQNSACKR